MPISHPILNALAQEGYSPYIRKIAAAQLALASRYLHSGPNEDDVYMITWMGSNGSTDRDVDGEAHAAVDHGSGEMPGIIRTHKTTIFDCSCQFPKRWGCFCRHMACVYILTNTTSPPPWHHASMLACRSRAGPHRNLSGIPGPDASPCGSSRHGNRHAGTDDSCGEFNNPNGTPISHYHAPGKASCAYQPTLYGGIYVVLDRTTRAH